MTDRKQHLRTIATLAVVILLWVPLFASADGLGTMVAEGMWNITVVVFGSFLGLGALLLNSSIELFVIGFADTFLNHGVGWSVEALWKIIRDLFNLSFIFALVFLGFQMILGGTSTQTKRWLAHLIIAALLVNFSLYITKLVVDISNLLSSQIVLNGLSDSNGKIDIATIFMNSLGIQRLLSFSPGSNLPTAVAASGIGWASMGYIFGATIMFIIGGFVFGAGGVLLTIRFASLCLFMALSPLMFLGYVFPQLEGTVGKYWGDFFKKAFFAPVYLLLLYFSGMVMQAYAATLNRADFAGVLAGSGRTVMSSFGDTIPPFVLSCIFLIASLTVANKLSADGAGKVMAIGKQWTNKAQNYANRAAKGAVGAATYAPRKAGAWVGRTATAATGRGLERTLNSAQSNKYLGRVARSVLIEDAVRGSARKMQDSKFGLKYTEAGAQKRVNEIATRHDNLQSYQQQSQAYFEAQRTNNASGMEDASSRLAVALSRISDDDLVRMSKDELQAGGLAKHLSDAQIKTLAASGKFTNQDIKDIKDARNADTFGSTLTNLNDANTSLGDLEKAADSLAKTLKGLSDERVKNIGVDILRQAPVAANLSQTQFDAYMKSDASASDKQAVKDARAQAFKDLGVSGTYLRSGASGGNIGTINAAATGNSTDAINFRAKQREKVLRRSADDIANMPAEVFFNPESYKFLTPAGMEARLRKNDLSDNEISRMQGALAISMGGVAIDDPSTKNTPWYKWYKSNSTYAAQFFA